MRNDGLEGHIRPGMPPKDLRTLLAKAHKDLFWQMGAWATNYWKDISVLKQPSDLHWYCEVFWESKPDFYVETGTWEGGSAIYFADQLKAMGLDCHVITIDNAPRSKLDYPGVTQIVGGALDEVVLNRVRSLVKDASVMVTLDDDHTRKHVAEEMEVYGELVTPGQHMVVEDLMPFDRYEDGAYLVENFLAARDGWELQPDKYPEGFSAGGWIKRCS